MKRDVCPAALRALLGMLFVCLLATEAAAQSVPSPWTAGDVGAPTLAGSATYSSGVFSIDAAGVDIWGTSDQFHFVYQAVSGDVDIVARVDSLAATNDYAKAGVMIRASLNANAALGSMTPTATRGVFWVQRLTSGATATSVAGPAVGVPVWVKLSRRGNVVTGYSSMNGTSWTTISSATLPLGATAYVGIAVTSHNAAARTTAAVSNASITKLGLPSGQKAVDIGAPAIKGSTTYSAGKYTISAAGKDIWDTSDQFHFVYQQMTGDGEVVARVASITNVNAWSKAGVMIRESLTAPSRHAMVVTSVSKGYAFQRRPDPGAYSVHTSGGTGTAPGWVRLVRTGDLFEAYRSGNGTTWTKIGSDTIAMADTVYVGLAVTSHNISAATTVVADSFKVTTTSTGNQPPAVSVTAPAVGAQFIAPATVTISATATDPEGRMASVDFYAGSTLISTDSTAPYSASWSASTAGTYSLTAVAHDADGGTSTSGGVSVSVVSGNRRPTVSLTSPTAEASFTAPATIALAATASDPENQLARVEFFNGTTRLGTDTTAPYSFSWSSVAAGTFTLTAVAYDAAGASATSAAVTVTVSGATTTPPRYVVFTASADHATNVTNYMLKIFAAGANPSTATPIATSDLAKPTPDSNNEITVDRLAVFTGLATGSYVAAVTAIGPGGQTPSSSITFTR